MYTLDEICVILDGMAKRWRVRLKRCPEMVEQARAELLPWAAEAQRLQVLSRPDHSSMELFVAEEECRRYPLVNQEFVS